jgi:hypothetical protein
MWLSAQETFIEFRHRENFNTYIHNPAIKVGLLFGLQLSLSICTSVM